ncbi:hypothetical protein Bcep1808_3768 [Burkholderia vietnamiensis G4]|uniref:Uncharacterized protein n=1 Tax=Burkholderia vietnamiensis (strain G4 / LMG 22486) TaxID=269482 RepID=A4JKE8_BURVG|nr:hypothetical protein Bcep1808_3768 [Burkholderia vietnamiensis G4]
MRSSDTEERVARAAGGEDDESGLFVIRSASAGLPPTSATHFRTWQLRTVRASIVFATFRRRLSFDYVDVYRSKSQSPLGYRLPGSQSKLCRYTSGRPSPFRPARRDP